jgi:hypothetical protein
VLFALSIALGFDLRERMETALDYHDWWKRGVPTALWRAMSLVEFGLYAGLPLFVLFVHRSAASVAALARRSLDTRDVLAAGLAVLVAALAAAQGTNEVARMWLFLVPFIALVVASGLRDLARPGSDDPYRLTAPLFVLALAQALVAVVMKGYQDW